MLPKEDSSPETLSNRVYLLNLNLEHGFISLIKQSQTIKAVYKTGLEGGMEIAYKVFVGKPKRKRRLERHSYGR